MRNITTSNTYNGHPLSQSWKNNHGFYLEILQQIEAMFNYMISKHSNVLFVRFDLRFPAESACPNDNFLLSKFVEAFRLQCKRIGYDPQYLWVREYSDNGRVHYHFILLLNGNYIQDPYILICEYATRLWGSYVGTQNEKGLVHYVNLGKYGGVIRRNDPNIKQVLDNMFQHASYLAKCYSKGNAHPHINGFRCSKLPHTLQ